MARKIAFDRTQVHGIVVKLEKLSHQFVMIAASRHVAPAFNRFLPVERRKTREARRQRIAGIKEMRVVGFQQRDAQRLRRFDADARRRAHLR